MNGGIADSDGCLPTTDMVRLSNGSDTRPSDNFLPQLPTDTEGLKHDCPDRSLNKRSSVYMEKADENVQPDEPRTPNFRIPMERVPDNPPSQLYRRRHYAVAPITNRDPGINETMFVLPPFEDIIFVLHIFFNLS